MCIILCEENLWDPRSCHLFPPKLFVVLWLLCLDTSDTLWLINCNCDFANSFMWMSFYFFFQHTSHTNLTPFQRIFQVTRVTTIVYKQSAKIHNIGIKTLKASRLQRFRENTLNGKTSYTNITFTAIQRVHNLFYQTLVLSIHLGCIRKMTPAYFAYKQAIVEHWQVPDV